MTMQICQQERLDHGGSQHAAAANQMHMLARYLLLLSPLVPCTLDVPSDIKNLFLFQKNRFLGSDLKSYLGIQYGTFLLRKKKIVLLYVRRVILVPISEKNYTPRFAK